MIISESLLLKVNSIVKIPLIVILESFKAVISPYVLTRTAKFKIKNKQLLIILTKYNLKINIFLIIQCILIILVY